MKFEVREEIEDLCQASMADGYKDLTRDILKLFAPILSKAIEDSVKHGWSMESGETSVTIETFTQKWIQTNTDIPNESLPLDL